MNAGEFNEWVFGGPLAKVPPENAWGIFAGIAGFCVVFAWVSYRCSVVRLGHAPAAVLMLLRAGLLVALLYCLANPVRIERHAGRPPQATPAAPPATRLAVVVDRSDSMTQPDNRGRSRLDDALVNWRRLEKTAQTFYGETQYYSFAEDLRRASTLEEAASRRGGSGETRLYQSISSLLKNAKETKPDAIVVLTDGIDTSGDSESVLHDAAIAAGVPIYFVAGNNRLARPEPFLRVREWRVPTTAVRSSQFSLEATFEAFSRDDRTVPFSLWQGGRRISRGELALMTGANLVPRSFPVAVGEPGPVEFVLRLGEGDDAPVAARAVTEVLPPQLRKVNVLIYQGALDWGFRAFTEALRTDSSFQFVSLLSADVGAGFTRAGPTGSPAIGKLMDTAAAFSGFDCVVLAHPYPNRIATVQQQALVDFVRGGGTVLVVSPDAEALPQFAEGPLQEILPVFFDGPVVKARNAGNKLVPLSLTEPGRGTPIFARADGKPGEFLLPRFIEYVPVFRAKPGAEVLAVHPTASEAVSQKPAILLATQSFGRGRSALLMTDALWRWKLDEPSQSRVVETFWQQLLLAIGRRPVPPALHFAGAPAHVGVGERVKLRLGGLDSDRLPVVVAKAPDGQFVTLPVSRADEGEERWTVAWTPGVAGGWEVAATAAGAHGASIFPTAVKEVVGELARTAPALDVLRTLAGETGGALLMHEPPPSWQPPEAKKEKPVEAIVSERRQPKWNNWSVLALALGLYAAELLLRRRWKLL